MAHNVQVKRSWAAGPICRSEPGRAHTFFLPVRGPEKASGVPRSEATPRLTDCYAQCIYLIFSYSLDFPR